MSKWRVREFHASRPLCYCRRNQGAATVCVGDFRAARARLSYVEPSSGIFRIEPHALQCTGSIVALQPASRAKKPHLARAQQCAGEIEEQRHAENYDDDRDQTEHGCFQG
jgi:hypothetical protein